MMNKKNGGKTMRLAMILTLIFILGLVLGGCTQGNYGSGYATANSNSQDRYVGGGCGVGAPPEIPQSPETAQDYGL